MRETKIENLNYVKSLKPAKPNRWSFSPILLLWGLVVGSCEPDCSLGILSLTFWPKFLQYEITPRYLWHQATHILLPLMPPYFKHSPAFQNFPSWPLCFFSPWKTSISCLFVFLLLPYASAKSSDAWCAQY